MCYDYGLQVYWLGLLHIGLGLWLRFVLTRHNNVFAIRRHVVYIPVLKIWLRRNAKRIILHLWRTIKLKYVKICEIISAS